MNYYANENTGEIVGVKGTVNNENFKSVPEPPNSDPKNYIYDFDNDSFKEKPKPSKEKRLKEIKNKKNPSVEERLERLELEVGIKS